MSLRERLIEEKILKKGWKKLSRELSRENKIMRRRREEDLVVLKRVEAAYATDRERFDEVVARLVEERDAFKDAQRQVIDAIEDLTRDRHPVRQQLKDAVNGIFYSIEHGDG